MSFIQLGDLPKTALRGRIFDGIIWRNLFFGKFVTSYLFIHF